MLKALYMDCKGWPRCLELLMWIVKLALRRPYTFVVMVILMLVFGVAAIIEMSVAERCLVYSVGIDVHHDGAVLAAAWQRDSGALHGGELRSYEVLAVIVKLHFGECFTLHAQVKDGTLEASKDRISGGSTPSSPPRHYRKKIPCARCH
jgi:hypothetical protein